MAEHYEDDVVADAADAALGTDAKHLETQTTMKPLRQLYEFYKAQGQLQSITEFRFRKLHSICPLPMCPHMSNSNKVRITKTMWDTNFKSINRSLIQRCLYSNNNTNSKYSFNSTNSSCNLNIMKRRCTYNFRVYSG